MQVMRRDKTNVWPSDWRVFLTKMAWGLAVLLLASGLVTWIAANWPGWGPVAKLSLAQGAVAVSALLALLMHRRPGSWERDLGVSAALTGLAAVGCGGLFALIGQIYQTGADPWQLFALWAVLILPWVLVVRSVFLSVLWLVVLNTAVYLWIDTQPVSWTGVWEHGLVWLGLGINAVLLLLAETVWRPRHDPWRLVARTSGVAVAGFIAYLAIEQDLWPALALYLALYSAYWRWRHDLFMLALFLMGAYGVVAVLIIQHLVDVSLLLVLLALIPLGLALLRMLQWHLAQWQRESPPDQEAAQQKDAHGDDHYPWYLRVVKLALYIVLPLLVLLYLALSLNLSLEAMGALGAVMALVSPLLYAHARTLARRDLVGGWVVCAVLLLSAVVLDERLPWPVEISALIGTVIGGLLYWQARAQSVLRFLLATWVLLGLQFLLLDRVWERVHDVPVWLFSLPGLFFFLLAVVLGHRSFSQPGRDNFWVPLFWALLLYGQWRAAYWGYVRWDAADMTVYASWSMTGLLLAAVPVLILVFYWRDWRSTPKAAGVALAGLLALCAAWLPYPPVAQALSWILLAYAWRYRSLLAVGIVLGLASLWHLYYFMNISLLEKAWLLLGTGAGCLVLAYLGQGRRPAQERVVSAATRGIVVGVAAGLVLILAAANGVIAQKERILADGRIVVLELAPVDPRSLMQGDYMALDFAVSRQLDALLEQLPAEQAHIARGQKRLRVGMQIDAGGVAQVRGVYLEQDGRSVWIAPGWQAEPDGLVMVQLRRRNAGWSPGTDAWFFAEGAGQRFEAARYGQFAVSESGQALLRRMLDAQLQEIR
ncbi:GDYXXLXY domain-containing protein [Alcaligenes sp. SDU_A2]|uniref:GDYXXLXY domain-containing protein n=1 Tax=Alcaligenes sp. SDU_A2 TaxID=3136634 RepID=UPI00311F48BF